MKKFFLPLLALSTLFLGSACDKIDPDNYLKAPRETGGGVDASADTTRKVFLEEFTGVKCNNCPAANAAAKNLQNAFGKDRLFLIGIHAGNLAAPDDKHPADFRTTEGNELFSFFQLFGVPVGFVDRTEYPARIIKGQGQWASSIQAQLDRPSVAGLGLAEDSYNTGSRELTISGQALLIRPVEATDIKLVIYLAENGIIAPQTMGDKSINVNYEHNHVLRGSFTGTWGQSIDLSQGAVNFSESITLDAEVIKENCEVMAFIYDAENYEILQSAFLSL